MRDERERERNDEGRGMGTMGGDDGGNRLDARLGTDDTRDREREVAADAPTDILRPNEGRARGDLRADDPAMQGRIAASGPIGGGESPERATFSDPIPREDPDNVAGEGRPVPGRDDVSR
jgi:hypothetical protein